MTYIDQVFSLMDNWRHLPAYQLERRADIFFAIYLPELIELEFGKTVQTIIPEFPVRIGTIDPKHDINRSFKIDYLAKIRDAQEVFFIELKTDRRSRRTKQDWYLQRAMDVGLPSILHGINLIYAATTHKSKYDALIRELAGAELITASETSAFNVVETDYQITTLYIQPNKATSGESVLTFESIADHLAKKTDTLSVRFVKSLREWTALKAGNAQRAS